jgi:zinc finger MYND domain-containing protein 10
MESRTRVEEFQEQIDDLEFSICMMCVSIMRFITDHVKHLPLNVVHHMLVETDMLSLFVPLVEERPWLRTNKKNEREIFEGQKWVFIPKEEYGRLPKLEAQVWIAVYNIFMDNECKSKYELNEYRKSNLLRV